MHRRTQREAESSREKQRDAEGSRGKQREAEGSLMCEITVSWT